MLERFASTKKVRVSQYHWLECSSVKHNLIRCAPCQITDHTIANLCRMQLLRDPNVRFAGYYHPHPLVHHINMKVQTNNSNVAPVEVLSSAIEDLSNETDHLITQFQDAMEAFKRNNEGAQF